MNVTIVGTGYVGLVSGVCLAARGHDVRCVDVNPEVVARLNAGTPHIHERGLPDLLKSVLAEGHFRATTDLEAALASSEVALIAVGTPSEGGVIDLGFVRTAARSIGRYIGRTDRHISVVVKSTVIPGTTDSVVRRELEEASGKPSSSFGLGMNPEFLREGEAVEDFSSPDRIVLGYEDPRTLERLEQLYAPWNVDKVRVNTRTAEMIKYANNCLLATQISAINEIANLSAALGGIDVMEVVEGVHLDKRWAPILPNGGRTRPEILTYLVPGCGFGGSCFPKDVQALRSQGEQSGLDMAMLNAVLKVNDLQPYQVVDILEREVRGLRGRQVLVLGLAFKPGTDDARESASLKIISGLVEKGAQVKAHDPVATSNFRKLLGREGEQVAYVEAWRDEAATADIVIVATRWPEYRDLAGMKLKGKIVFDARRMFSPVMLGDATYLSIGRRMHQP